MEVVVQWKPSWMRSNPNTVSSVDASCNVLQLEPKSEINKVMGGNHTYMYRLYMCEKNPLIYYIYYIYTIYIYTIYILYIIYTIYIYIYYIYTIYILYILYTIYIYILNPKDTKDWFSRISNRPPFCCRVAVPCRRPHATGAPAERTCRSTPQAEPRDPEGLSSRPVATEPGDSSQRAPARELGNPLEFVNLEWTDSERSLKMGESTFFWDIQQFHGISWDSVGYVLWSYWDNNKDYERVCRDSTTI